MNDQEFKKTLESHLPTEFNTKMEHIERFASLLINSYVGPTPKADLLPPISYVSVTFGLPT